MRLADNSDLKELDYITKVERILALRQDELLKPEGLRGNMYERWWLLIKDLLTPVYEAEKLEIINARTSTQAAQAEPFLKADPNFGKDWVSQEKRPSGKTKKRTR